MATSNILFKSFKQKKAVLFFIVINIMVINIINGAISPELFRKLVTSLSQGDSSSLIKWICILAAFLIVMTLLIMLNKLLIFIIQRHSSFYVEDVLIGHYRRLDYWEENMSAAETLAIIRKVAPQISEDAVSIYASIIGQAILLITACVYTAWLSPLVLSVTFILTGFIMLLMRRGIKKLPELQKDLNTRFNDIHGKLWEQINNNEISGFLNSKRVPCSYLNTTEDCINDLKQVKKIGNSASFARQFGSLFMIIITAGLGGLLSIWGVINIESVYAMVIVIPMIASVLLGIPSIVTGLKTLVGNYKTVDDFLKSKEYKADDKISIDKTIESLHVNNLFYTYPGNKDAAVSDITFKLEAGVIYLIGTSGCGKSTLMKILARILPYSEGQVLVEDIELNSCERGSLYKHLSYIDQIPHVLPGTILYNITMGGKVDDARLKTAIDDATLTDLIDKLGLDAIVSKETMSNGELQKICFARAFYRQCDVMLLDEATAALDPSAADSVINAMERRIAAEKKLAIVITHRYSCLRENSRVIMLESGRLKFNGNYKKLSDTFSSNEIDTVFELNL